MSMRVQLSDAPIRLAAVWVNGRWPAGVMFVVAVSGVVVMGCEQSRAGRWEAWCGGHGRRVLVRGAAGVVTVTVAASVGVWGAGLAAADPAGVTLHYTCSLAPYPDQPMTAQVTWDGPTSAVVGQATRAVAVTATATIGPAVTWALGQVGAATIEGSADGPGMVVAPEGNVSTALEMTALRTDVPASGPLIVQATGTTPRFVFHQPGHATVTVGNDFTAHVTLRDANGNPTGPGEVDPSCTLDPGQSTVVTSFDITSPVVPTPPRTTKTKTAGTGTRETITPGPSGSTSAPTGSAAPRTAVSVTAAPTPATPTTPTTPATPVSPTAAARAKGDSPAATPASWTGGPTGTGGWLVVAAVVTAGAGVIGGVWWLKRRRGRQVPRH
jgi:hypothetical protein